MKKSEFLREVENLASRFSGEAFAAEIWIGRVVRDRLASQDTISRADIACDLEALLEKHKDHPSFPKTISQALEKLGE